MPLPPPLAGEGRGGGGRPKGWPTLPGRRDGPALGDTRPGVQGIPAALAYTATPSTGLNGPGNTPRGWIIS